MKHHKSQPCFRLIMLFLAVMAGAAEAYTFRVLVAYTQQAEAMSFGPHVAAERINGIAREVYQSSSPNYSGYQMPKIELAGTVKVNYTGSLTGPAKIALRGKTDGSMDEIHALREWYEADIVVLFHPFTDNGGEAFDIEINHENKAFAVASVGNSHETVVAHEIGHLVGCVHDHEDPAFVPPSIEYAYGYRGPGNAWGDVMTYHGNRKKWFSNPYETYNGAARGIVDSADCTRKHHERKSILSAYRTTSQSLLNAGRALEKNESIFWNLPGIIYFTGSDTISGGVVSLKGGWGVSLWSYEGALIEFKSGNVFLKSPDFVEFTGTYAEGSWAWVATDSLIFQGHYKGTHFKSSVANLMANTIHQRDGSRLTISTDTSGGYEFGSTVYMEASRRIRLTSGVKIKGVPYPFGAISLRVSGSFDPLATEHPLEHILEKPAIQASARSDGSELFRSRVIQEQGKISLEYTLEERGPMSVRVFDLKGKQAAVLDVRHSQPGRNVVAIPGSFQKGTVYFLRVTSNGKVYTHRFVSGM